MALRAGVPVVPAAVSGTYEALAGRRFYIPRGRPLAVRFGQPLYFHQRRRASHAEREEITRRIMGHIEALLHAGRPAESRRGEAGVS
jgi:1-acyl-sn-glycerol-3-phosphate acyltransferase